MYYSNLVIDNKSRYTDELYTYGSHEPLKKGDVVSVSFGLGSKEKRAFVFETNVKPGIDLSKIKVISGKEEGISLNEEMISTVVWMRQRYGIKYIDGINCFIPPGKAPKPGKEKMPYKDLCKQNSGVGVLTSEQSFCLKRIEESISRKQNKSFLLHGVTGSGKTEVYMNAISYALERGESTIMLVPEIALTRQISERFAARFGRENIAILHSKLTKRERFDEWTRVRKGTAKITIGARMGIFAPSDNLGLIILDEEHEGTYKSDQLPKYETVDIAMKRLMHGKGTMILGSATPSVVSYQRCKEGIYELLEMKRRYNNVELPEVATVDMRRELRSGNVSMFSRKLKSSMEKTLSAGEQMILFLNRRGYSTSITCRNCGKTMSCPDCGITLVYHKAENAAVCHYCGKKQPVPVTCPDCGSEEIRRFGIGTEQVEEEVKKIFPEKKVERLDLDTAGSTKEINRIFKNFAEEKTDILIGTQLVAKGLDFKNVGLVGVISADVSLNIPDYRATERTFQLVTQVAGRAGRGERQGKVIVQSYTPENFAIAAACEHDYRSFFNQEIKIRKFMNYPPYSDLISVEFTSKDGDKALNRAAACMEYLKKAGLPGAENIFPPQLSEAFRGKDSFRYYILIKCPKGARNEYLYYLSFFERKERGKKNDCVQTIDVNPYSVF